MSSVLQAIGFMVLGGTIVELFEIHAWRRYQQGKREGGYPMVRLADGKKGRIS